MQQPSKRRRRSEPSIAIDHTVNGNPVSKSSWVGFDPEAAPSQVTKAIVEPSGDQAGWVGRGERRSAASWIGSDPSSAIVYTNQSSPARAEKAMEFPSGDQLG